MTYATTEQALAAIGRGELVVVMDDDDRENEGDLIFAAEAATPEKLGFMIRHTSGVICATLSPSRAAELQLPLMVAENSESHRTAFTVSVDYLRGTSTGISAADRALTIPALADPVIGPGDFARPGHVFPLRAREGGVLERMGHTEAACDLARLSVAAAHAPRHVHRTRLSLRARWRRARSTLQRRDHAAGAARDALGRAQPRLPAQQAGEARARPRGLDDRCRFRAANHRRKK